MVQGAASATHHGNAVLGDTGCITEGAMTTAAGSQQAADLQYSCLPQLSSTPSSSSAGTQSILWEVEQGQIPSLSQHLCKKLCEPRLVMSTCMPDYQDCSDYCMLAKFQLPSLFDLLNALE
jgi:hypothetical protein